MGPNFEIGKTDKPVILEIAFAGRMLVRLNYDGTMEFGPTYHPGEAARVFWRTIRGQNPVIEIQKLQARVAELEQEKLDIEAELESTVAQIGEEPGDASGRPKVGPDAGASGKEPGFEGGGPLPVGVNDPGVKHENPHRAGYPSAVLDGQLPPSVKAVGESKCERCRGCGRIADSEDGEPWTDWLALPVRSATAVTAGLVKPIPCPSCNGIGRK